MELIFYDITQEEYQILTTTYNSIMKNKLSLFVSILVISIVFFSCKKQEADPIQELETNDPLYDKNQGAHIVASHLTKKLEDRKGIVMYELTMEPGDTLPWHEHPPHTFYTLEEGTLEVIFEDSTKTSFYPEGQTNFGSPSREMAINKGETTIKMLFHDFYYLAPEEPNDPHYDVNRGAHIVAPNLTKILQDKHGIVMYELTIKPGETLPWHEHPLHTFYILEEGTLEITSQNSTRTSSYFKGQTNFNNSFSDIATNIGETTIKVLMHEFYSLE